MKLEAELQYSQLVVSRVAISQSGIHNTESFKNVVPHTFGKENVFFYFNNTHYYVISVNLLSMCNTYTTSFIEDKSILISPLHCVRECFKSFAAINLFNLINVS